MKIIQSILKHNVLVEPSAARLLAELSRCQEKRLLAAIAAEKPLIVTPKFILEAALNTTRFRKRAGFMARFINA